MATATTAGIGSSTVNRTQEGTLISDAHTLQPRGIMIAHAMRGGNYPPLLPMSCCRLVGGGGLVVEIGLFVSESANLTEIAAASSSMT